MHHQTNPLDTASSSLITTENDDGRQDQRVASLFQVLRKPRDQLCQFRLTTSQFTIGRWSVLVCVAALEGSDIDASYK
jgi:hypothetical protein